MAEQTQAALYHSRQRRLERVYRLGLNREVDARVAPGTGISSPVSDAEGAAFGAVIMEIESLDGPFEGVVLNIGASDVITMGATDVTLEVGGTISETEAHGVVASGFYTLVALFDPLNNRADLFIDGRLICTGSGAYAAWGAAASAWIYANALTSEGQIRDAEVVLTQVPGIYVV